jgi:Tol biopolymer transport system component
MTRRGIAAVCSIIALLPVLATAATRYDPRLRFQTMSTPRFDIHFHQGEEGLARRLQSFVEKAASEVDAAVGAAVGRVQIVLVNQDDLSNGWATPVPYNTIEISVAAPTVESVIGNSPDWLRLVFVHEYTHIAHLSRAGGWLNGLRRGFGRLPLLFPNLYQPIWAIEGIATWDESHQTRQGRVVAGDFRVWLKSAAAAGRLEPIDRVNGGNVDWPGGNGPYLYGAYFHEFLAQKYGADSIRTLAAETGRRIPYLGWPAYKKVYGRSLGELWRDFERSVDAGEPAAPATRAVRLTHQGFRVATPRLRADGHLFYSSITPHGFPALMELAPEGEPRFVSRRYPGGAIAVAGDRLVLDELDLVRSVAVQSDLYVVEPRSGERRRITREARAADPDVAGDGTSVVCTIQMADRRALATFTLPGPGQSATPQGLVSEPAVSFAIPRWSPDGKSIVAERRQPEGLGEIALIDVTTRVVRTLASVPGARAGSPVWTPDGTAVLFSAASADAPFRIYRVVVATGAISRLEGTGVSAQSPTISADGRRLVFAGYTAEGYDLFAIDLTDAEWTAVDGMPQAPRAQTPPPAAGADTSLLPAARPVMVPPSYSPWPTLRPTFWTPTLESDADEVVVGGATGSADALGRHAYGIEAGWSTRARPDWQVAYAYDRWRPTLFASFSDDTDPWRDGDVRTREADAGMLLPFQQVRLSQSILATVHVADDEFDCRECQSPVAASVTRRSIRGGYALSTTQQYGYSISSEEGSRASLTAEASRATVEADPNGPLHGNGLALTADLRHFVPLGRRHGVLAVRLAAAGYFGSDEAEQVFSVSGNGPQSAGFGFGVDAIGLLRGFSEDALTGTRAAVVNVDYRLPLMRIARGLGIVPAFIRNLHGAVFADIGEAWNETARWEDVSASFGAELSADTVIGFVLPVTLTGGIALRRDGPARDRDLVVFGRIGRAF